jgi:hypothetical protein
VGFKKRKISNFFGNLLFNNKNFKSFCHHHLKFPPHPKKNSFKFNSHFGEISPRKTKKTKRKEQTTTTMLLPHFLPRVGGGYLRESIKFCAHDRFRV